MTQAPAAQRHSAIGAHPSQVQNPNCHLRRPWHWGLVRVGHFGGSRASRAARRADAEGEAVRVRATKDESRVPPGIGSGGGSQPSRRSSSLIMTALDVEEVSLTTKLAHQRS
jgi:hypothetical protein